MFAGPVFKESPVYFITARNYTPLVAVPFLFFCFFDQQHMADIH